MKARNSLIIGCSAAIAAVLFLTDPSGGVSTGIMLMSIAVGIIAVLFAHYGRKLLHNYPAANMENLFKKAGEHPVGAGLALIALSIVFNGLLGLFGRGAHAAEIPKAALPYVSVLKAEQQRIWPDHSQPWYFGGLVEHETACPRVSMCWKPTAQLKTQREEGAGFAQITRAYRADGSLRFDALQEMKDRHPLLAELNWGNVYQRPDLQLRVIVLKSHDDWRWLGQPPLEFVDLAYNAGRGRVSQDRRACQMTQGCDPMKWAGHVEKTCTASRQPIYGTRSACDISRHHVHDVFARAEKYRGVL